MDTNAPQQSQKTGGIWHTLREWLQVIVIALVISLPIRFFVAEPFIVNGASMDPTFSTGQFLIVDRLTYRLTDPKRNDVVVFEYPNNPSVYYIKRIIGLPGEKLSITDGQVTVINTAHPKGLKLSEPYIDAAHISHETMNVELGPTEYFVMGDNRAQSSDSRVWGNLDRHFITGRPIARLYPIAEAAFTPGEYNDQESK